MKKRNLFVSLVALAFIAISATFTSCETEDGPGTITASEGNVAGDYTDNLLLEAGKNYTLDGACIIKEGATLTIEAGVKIVAKGGTTSYIAIAQGAKIMVEGTKDNPVIMTADVEDYGQWGGLVICGKAPVNTGDGGLSEVANLPYGGDVADDNSGSITYLRVEYTGYQYNAEKQFNGVSFFGVGSGTTVEYVSSYMGNDDGLEFFGGSVNASYIVSISSQDDGIDFADGWSGTGDYWYSVDSQKSGIEGSNNGKDFTATPMTSATVSNATIIGMGEKPWFLKEGAGNQTIDNVVIGGLTNFAKAPFFYISSDDADAKTANISITNVKFVGVNDEDKADASLAVTENANADGAGNGAGVPSWAEGWAFPTGWAPDVTVLEAGNIAGEYDANVILDNGNTYTLDGAMVLNGGYLTIPEGTTVTAKGGTTSYIAIAQGAKTYINGTASAPVVMTADIADYGQWGGLVLCGYAPVNTGEGGLSEVANLPYGGDAADDNSGSITYLRVEYTGYQYNSEKQFNGVSFFGVGSGTTVDYVSSYKGNDDGLEFFGGAVSASHIVSIESQDDGIDFADGWSGTGEYWYSKDSKKSGIEGSNNGKDFSATPMTSATVSNVTIIGMGEKPWFLKEGAGKQTIDNVVIGGLTNPDKAPYFYIASDDADAKALAAAGDIKITNVRFVSIGADAKADDSLTITEDAAATGAGNGADAPDWAAGWAMPN